MSISIENAEIIRTGTRRDLKPITYMCRFNSLKLFADNSIENSEEPRLHGNAGIDSDSALPATTSTPIRGSTDTAENDAEELQNQTLQAKSSRIADVVDSVISSILTPTQQSKLVQWIVELPISISRKGEHIYVK